MSVQRQTHASPSPSFFRSMPLEKTSKDRDRYVTLATPTAISLGPKLTSIKQRVECNCCQLRFERFYEVRVRLGMLLKLFDPRRDHDAPTLRIQICRTDHLNIG
jgi:hypothetical protein